MAKKFKKTAKEIERLSGLYKHTSQPIGVASPIVNTVSGQAAEGTLAAAHNQKHIIIRHDLITLLIVAAIMLVALFALNYAVDHTIVGTWLNQVVSKFI
ncbi:TPA: hypothetical protein DIV45_02990 [Patescibacteria group bacterium]|nr:hypothetical protein [Patescibacteria group bacterium]